MRIDYLLRNSNENRKLYEFREKHLTKIWQAKNWTTMTAAATSQWNGSGIAHLLELPPLELYNQYFENSGVRQNLGKLSCQIWALRRTLYITEEWKKNSVIFGGR